MQINHLTGELTLVHIKPTRFTMGIISFAKRNYIFTPEEIKEKKIIFHLSTIYFDKIFYDTFSKYINYIQTLIKYYQI